MDTNTLFTLFKYFYLFFNNYLLHVVHVHDTYIKVHVPHVCMFKGTRK